MDHERERLASGIPLIVASIMINANAASENGEVLKTLLRSAVVRMLR